MTASFLKIKISVIICLTMVVAFGCKTELKKESAPTPRTKQIVYSELLKMELRNPDRLSSPFSKASDLIREYQFKAAGEPADSMRILLTRFVDNTLYHKDLKITAVKALELFPIEKTRPDLERFLKVEDIALPAAGILLNRGMPDQTLPVVVRHEAWYLLRDQPDSVAVPVLNRAASGQSETILGRIRAAHELTRFDDDKSELQTARAIMKDYLVDKIPAENAHDLSKAIVECCELLKNESNPADIDLLKHGAIFQDSGIQNQCIGALFVRAANDDNLALETLSDIANGDNSTAVIFARSKLSQLESKQ